MQLDLLAHALARWPGRGSRILEINCGRGYFLSFLERAGFMTTATEHDRRLRQIATTAAATGQELLAAADDDLPFADGAFDWALLHLRDNRTQAMARSIDECARVAARGFAVTFWNRLSLAMLCDAPQRAALREFSAPVPFWKPWLIMRRCPGSVALASTLALPARTWSDRCAIGSFNGWGRPFPFGAWCVIRLDKGPSRPMTGLPLRLERAGLAADATAMDYADRVLVKNRGNI